MLAGTLSLSTLSSGGVGSTLRQSLGRRPLLNKDEYLLLDQDVRAFVDWLAAELGQPRTRHSYVTARRKVFSFDGLACALSQYEWPFSSKQRPVHLTTYAYNERVLSRLAREVRQAFAATDEPALVKTCVEIFKWGGVSAHNIEWIQTNSASLLNEIQTVSRRLQSDDDSLATLQPIRRFNSAMSKVYALLLPAFIIYDSRVAAALTWFVAHWCRHTRRREVPASLAFACMPAKEASTARVRKLRNPSAGALTFPQMNSDKARHAHWNMRASWLLERTIHLTDSDAFKGASQPLRALEAALFMWGYDVGASIHNAQTPGPVRP